MKVSSATILLATIATMSLAGCVSGSTARPDAAPVYLPPLAPEISQPAAPPVASRNPQIMANRAIDAFGVCTIKHAGAVGAYYQAAIELGKARVR